MNSAQQACQPERLVTLLRSGAREAIRARAGRDVASLNGQSVHVRVARAEDWPVADEILQRVVGAGHFPYRVSHVTNESDQGMKGIRCTLAYDP